MKKITPCTVNDKIDTIFNCERIRGTSTNKPNRSGEKYLATPTINPTLAECLESGLKYGVTGKLDGTCCLIKNCAIHKRRDINEGFKNPVPDTWFKTGIKKGKHLIGFMPLEKNDKWHYDCHPLKDNKRDMTKVMSLVRDSNNHLVYQEIEIESLEGKSVEVMGPKFNGNPHHLEKHCVIPHGLFTIENFPELKVNDSEALNKVKNWFINDPNAGFFEGIVLHFENGEMFKLHRHHLDLEWSPKTSKSLDKY
jgi:hypothetical protein